MSFSFSKLLFFAIAWCAAIGAALGQSQTPKRLTYEILFANHSKFEAMPLSWNKQQVYMLARDGAMFNFAPGTEKSFQKISHSFESYPATVLHGKLAAELGPKFEVTATPHFLVATTVGKNSAWAERFEEMYKSFCMYFQVRGFELTEPEFPMIAIIHDTQQDFQHYAAREGVDINSNVLGFYLLNSNRVAMFDDRQSKDHQKNWQQNMSTVVHEASHQTAFNTGIHSRWAPPPRWVAEGLGTMFEARGVGIREITLSNRIESMPDG